MQQLHALTTARACRGAVALANNDDGKPDAARPAAKLPEGESGGQLVYYFQAVDRFRHAQRRARHLEALKFLNLSKSAGLMGMLAIYIGMRVRLTKKV
jgi:hypothetical protein